MEHTPFYAVKGSPVFESPLNLFCYSEDSSLLADKYDVPPRYVKSIMSPWAVKRLHEFRGDISQFKVVKLHPSRLKQIGIAKNRTRR